MVSRNTKKDSQMINLIYLAGGGTVAYFLLNWISTLDIKPGIFPVMCVILFVVFAIWMACILADIKDFLRQQLSDFHSIKEFEREKTSYEMEMKSYQKEMKDELLTEYKNFEEKIMAEIKDSKIIATILEKNGYASVLKSYDNTIQNYLRTIHNTDRSIQTSIRQMKVRQGDSIYNYSLFIPKSIRYEEY